MTKKTKHVQVTVMKLGILAISALWLIPPPFLWQCTCGICAAKRHVFGAVVTLYLVQLNREFVCICKHIYCPFLPVSFIQLRGVRADILHFSWVTWNYWGCHGRRHIVTLLREIFPACALGISRAHLWHSSQTEVTVWRVLKIRDVIGGLSPANISSAHL